MNKYQVMLRGKNFLLDYVDEEIMHGFFVTYWVDANDPEEAELKAMNELRKDEELKSGILNNPEDTPMIYLEELRKLEPDSELQGNSGKSFFPELDEEGQNEAKKIQQEALWN